MVCNLYIPKDIEVKGECQVMNPFYAKLRGEFTSPSGKKLIIPGFYDANNTWKIRFSANELGTWEFLIVTEDITNISQVEGFLQVAANENALIHGGLKIHPDHPYHFQYEDGTNHFMMAYEVNWLWALGLSDQKDTKVQEFVDQISQYGFNQVLMNVFAYDTSWKHGNTSPYDYGPAEEICWEGSYENPDYTQMNATYFQNLDKVMQVLMNKGIIAHLYFKVYNKYVNWPTNFSREDELYFEYIVARYQAFPNVIWDFSKESYNEPDKTYIGSRLDFIREKDAYQRLLTVHDDKHLYADPDNRQKLDFITVQQHFDYHSQVMLQRALKQWPVLNAEFGYECGPNGLNDCTFTICQTPEEVIKRAYYVVMAGGYPAYYYTYTAWDIIDYSQIPRGYSYFKIMYDFFYSLEWWRFEPHNEMSCFSHTCLAIPQKEYVCFTTPPDETIYLNTKHKFNKLRVTWMNIYTGEKLELNEPGRGEYNPPEGYFRFTSPFKGIPSILHVVVID